MFIQGKIAIMNISLDLKALDFIREIDFSLIGKKGRGGGGERNTKEISNKNVPRPLIHEFSFCLLSLNNFPLTFLIEYCKWKKQINISPWPDVLSVMLFMIFFFFFFALSVRGKVPAALLVAILARLCAAFLYKAGMRKEFHSTSMLPA